MRLRRASRQHLLGEVLADERRRLDRIRLRVGELLAVDRRGRHLPLFDREQRLAGASIEHVDVAVLGDLGDGVHLAAVARHGHEARRGREIHVPDVVAYALEMPDALAGPRVECQDAVGVEVVAVTVGSVPVERRRSGCREDHARVRHQPSRRPTRWRHRRSSTRREATSRSPAHPDAGSCESSSAVRPS